MLKSIFQASSKAKNYLSLKNVFRAGTTSGVGAVVVAPEKTGEFIGTRVSGLFNGIMRGVGKGMLDSPALLAVGAAGLAVVGANIYNKLKR